MWFAVYDWPDYGSRSEGGRVVGTGAGGDVAEEVMYLARVDMSSVYVSHVTLST
jgi:hypothetical protein